MRIQLVIGLLIIVLATCSTRDNAHAEGGLEGQVQIGPTCPIVPPGQSCPTRPLPAALTIRSTDGRTVAQIQADAQGHFHIALPAGQYTLHPEPVNGLSAAPDLTFQVEAGRFTQLAVHYPS